MSENDIDKIDNVDFDHNESSMFSNQVSHPVPDKPSPWLWFGLAGLSVVALLVIFVLPSIVSEYELPLERRAEVAPIQQNQTAVDAGSAISPFEEAQRSLQRKDAQDVLADLLLSQAELDALEVSRWAQTDYDTALEQASVGDEYYRTQDFQLARDFYEAGREQLNALLETVPTVLSQTLIEAEQALVAADSNVALDKYSLALLFEPESEIAQIGLQRARSLDEVSGLLDEADDLLEAGELEQSRVVYQEILALDNYNQAAQEKIQIVSARIKDNEFSRIMSSGYALLERGAAEEAIDAFEQASNMGIRQDEAQAAITQTENEIANVAIDQSRVLISAAEANEQWQSAVDEYGNVLAIDANLVFAINGKDYAEKRAQLDSLLLEALDNPERFSEQSVFDQTLDVFYTGRAIENPGARLVTQLDELEVFLENSQVPIDIQLVSDNLTEVTLLRIGNLGIFEQTAVSLKPGRYVAVGKRIGYREVREEFTVGFGLTPDSVLVQCEERVIATNRR